MKKKQIIIIGVLIIFLIIVVSITLIINKSNNKPKNSNETPNNKGTSESYSQEKIKKDIKAVFEEAIKLNDLLNQDSLEKIYTYINDYDNACYRYRNSDEQKQIEKIREVYIVGQNLKLFEIDHNDVLDKEYLYVCPPIDCAFANTLANDIEIISNSNDEIKATVDGEEYLFKYQDKKLKLMTEAFKCNLKQDNKEVVEE